MTILRKSRKLRNLLPQQSASDNVRLLLLISFVIISAIISACVVTFQVFENVDINNYKTTHVATVGNIEECAYICYQNSCSGAVFIPSDSEDNKSKCKVQMREEEQCDGKLQRHYFFKSSKAVVLSCFRCRKLLGYIIFTKCYYFRARQTSYSVS